MASSAGVDGPKIMIVEHLVFFKLKDGYTQEQENDMYKGLWSFKDRYNSIMSMSLGRTMIRNVDGVTHVLYMRFPTKEALTEYLNDRYRLEISYKYIVPVFNGELVCDFEAEMESDLASLYREGENFEHGLEHVELFKVKEDTPASQIEEILSAFAELPKKAGTRIAQLTAGINYTAGQKYTFGLVARLPSVEALGAMLEDRAYQEVLEQCYPILEDHLQAAYPVDDSLSRVDEPYSKL
ncbi:hypothetical protein MPTK1_5g08010 [Marchantia polymorpha subsp. ruderalis]|uniref:Stress-response A/B barrel domain-containing protein n=2 Tax=Marchantia polymorpha TaxID=3197 RepID=A0AAF6BG33_MARPO|nr:hypothetical protein MARPO_0086s0005 [Marchantia polymorpha]PTQ33666.1 hypothetical protein MARPO_0086s0005 [Marchantia polymorpha]BBN10967.1 hypothetical protein Mp_5g08010 [Marchantia polymorpha subsp. ruderalis]BBN10968.1 hypothetical protein Mp_5g08010 [Marchantia polymorpha subsp. ruderalis]|eukprot:PTQ33665.1 hypothetical protein MARPO_0086s0005 [Marchantia polymorpha]